MTKNWHTIIKEFAIITFASIIVAISLHFFMFPSNIALGSTSAIAMMLSNVLPLSISTLNLILNVVLLFFGFLLIGPEFGIKTVYTTIIIPLILGVFELLFPNVQSLTQDPLIDAICMILIFGIAVTILFSYNASSGGLDIIAKIMNKYLHFDIGISCSIIGVAVSLCSVFYYDSKTAVISVLTTYCYGVILDRFIFGFNLKRRVCILSEKYKEIIDYILYDLKSGATLHETIGAYTNTKRIEITTLVDKHEFRSLMNFIKKCDPKALVTVYSINEVRYTPKNIKK